MMVLKVLLIIFIVSAALFVLSLIVYLFNLDMKLAAGMTSFMTKHYDRVHEKILKKQKKNDNNRIK